MKLLSKLLLNFLLLTFLGLNVSNAQPNNPARPAGSNTQVQFNDSGLFGGASGLTYNKTTRTSAVNTTSGTNPLDALTITHLGAHSTPGTTSHIRTENSGSWSWITNLFSGTIKSALGFNSSGQISAYSTNNSGIYYYNGISAPSLYSYNAPSVFGHYANGNFNGRVSVGTMGSPTATLENAGSTSLEIARITSNTTIQESDIYTNILCDAGSATCIGTPTYSCSTHTSEANCTARNSHGGCTWNPITCSNYNGSQFDCESNGCTYETASCSGFGDESTCNSYSGCSWNSNDCSALGQGTCGATSGCTENYSDCSSYNYDYNTCISTSGCSYSVGFDCSIYNGDESSCYSNGCNWDGMNCYGSCTGSYFSSCSGTYYSCGGSYYTGNCTGSGLGTCTGTPTCTGISGSTDCNNEAGCNWTTALTLTLPTLPNVGYNGREYRIKNTDTSGADCIITANTGQDIDGNSTLTLANYKDSTLLVYFQLLESCESFNQSQCEAQAECSPVFFYCNWNESTCEGNAVCTGIGDQMTCQATQYFSSCSGNYTANKRWNEMAKR